MKKSNPVINSEFWKELPQGNDPFCTETAICSGYNVYGDMLGKANYFEYIFLLFKHCRPTISQTNALSVLAFALANPGPRDPSVHAAMGAGMSNSTSASVLVAALACGAGSYGGARDVYLCMQNWQSHGKNITSWCDSLENPCKSSRSEVWPECEHPAGFASYDRNCGKPVIQTLEKLCSVLDSGEIAFLATNRVLLEKSAKRSVSMTGVAAACLIELGFTPQEGEMLTLLLRLPGAAAHALEQSKLGFRQFPFFEIDLQNDPEN